MTQEPYQAISSMNRVKTVIKNYYPALIIVVVVVILMKTVFFIGMVPTGSMEPTIPEESIILGLQSNSNIERGDIIVFKQNNSVFVKRVIGLPGDIVTFTKTEVFINGVKEENFTGDYTEKEYIVPDDNLFVMGDNRNNSRDSRYWENPYLEIQSVISNKILVVKPPWR